MSRKQAIAELGFLVAMGIASTGKHSWDDEPDIKPQPKPVIPNGCKEFDINGVKIIALNEKSARRKYEKLPR